MPKTKVFDENLKEYENWLISNKFVYQSELKAIEKTIPKNKKGVEIGIGSGLFAHPLDIKEGIDPSYKMREKARDKNLKVIDAVTEDLPFHDAIFFGTEEVYRILKNAGFKIEATYQTIFGKLNEIEEIQEVQRGYGNGSFVVIKARKHKL